MLSAKVDVGYSNWTIPHYICIIGVGRELVLSIVTFCFRAVEILN